MKGTKKEPKVIRVKTWTMTEFTHDDQSTVLNRKNDGFSFIELLGLIEFARIDILKQINGEMKPDIIKREVVQD